MTAAPLLEACALTRHYAVSRGLFQPRGLVRALDGVSFAVGEATTLAVVGESGCGKSTLARQVTMIEKPTAGELRIAGEDAIAAAPRTLKRLRPLVQMVFQNPYASLNPRFIIGQILTEPMLIHGIGSSAQERTDLAFEMLQKVGLPEVSFYKYPHEFSGGQRQRIAIARCLALKPDILICDESVSALDVSVQAQVLNLLQDLQDEFHLSYIFISHDLAVVKYISDQVMVMNQGRIIEIANSDDIYRNPQQPYTQKLLSSIPRGWHHGAA